VGLKDIQKNYMLTHALLNCNHAGKFAEYYMLNKLVIDKTIEGQLVDYIDEEVRRNLQSILDAKDYEGVTEKTTHRGNKNYTNVHTSIEQKRAISWILTTYKQKLEDDLLKKTSPIDTPLPQQETMYCKIEEDYYFVEPLTTESIIDPGCASTSIG
jgi:hypothetical protein